MPYGKIFAAAVGWILILQGSISLANQNLLATSSLPTTSMLVTAFEPFAGNFHNKSAETADILKRSLQVYLPSIHIEICILPVEYNRASEKLLSCLSQMSVPAQRVLSLGEKSTSVVRVETQAANWDNEFRGPDSAGVWRKGSVILPGAPTSVSLSGYPVDAMMKRIPLADQLKIVLSSNMDNFVCNNTAFITEMSLRGRLPFLFIHVPDGDSQNNDPRESARLILELAPWQS